MKFRILFVSAILYFQLGCTPVDKPEYILGDSILHMFEGGDQLSYSVLQDSVNGELATQISLTFENDVLLDPHNNSVNFLKEVHSGINNFTPPFISRYFTQSEQGNILLHAFNIQSNTYWLIDENTNNLVSPINYYGDMANTPSTYSISQKLQLCDGDICEISGIMTFSQKLVGTENISTPYAEFEAYQLEVSLTVSINAGNLSNNSLLYIQEGSEWIYPPLGVVKYNYDILNETSSFNLIGHLTKTNIPISSDLKK